jgi:DNA recombination protein RmuC
MEYLFIAGSLILFGGIGLLIGKALFKRDSSNSEESQKIISELEFKLQAEQKSVQLLKDEIETFKDKLEEYRNAKQRVEIELASQKTTAENLMNQLGNSKTKVADLDDKLSVANSDNNILKNDLAVAKADNKASIDKLNALKEEVNNSREKMKESFAVIAKEALKENTRELNEENSKGVGGLVSPLREDLEKFKKDFVFQIQDQNKDRGILIHQMKEMKEISEQLKGQTSKLASTLKGDKKVLGDWGENVLKTILEKSGLEKGVNYEFQYNVKDEEGKDKRPDIVVQMPENRCVVIDSKVSYVHYNEYQNAEDPSAAKDYLGMLTKDVKNHINGLAKKSYSDSIDNTMDFVMMFIPIEPALMAVLAYDQTLWEYAYKKRVLLIGPSNLISALKIVENLWVKEKQNVNTQAVMSRATKLIGKFDVVMDKLAQLGSHLNAAGDKYNETIVSFVDGNGSLKRQIEMMEELGASKEKGKTKRATPVLIENPTSISREVKDV